MQSEDKNDSVQLSTRYEQYMFAKRCFGGFGGRQVFPIRESDKIGAEQDGQRYAHCIQAGGDKHRGTYIESDIQQGLSDKRTAIRRLTPTECERLMGLPDGWTAKGNFDGETKEISDTQRYKLCGNGVVVNCVEEIIKRLVN